MSAAKKSVGLRTEQLRLRVTPEERRLFEKQAALESNGYERSLSDWLRRLAWDAVKGGKKKS